MIIYKFRPDMVYEGPVEYPDGPVIPKYHSFEAPPTIPPGFYAVMLGGWKLIEGTPPQYPPPEQIEKEVVDATQRRLDRFASTRNYDSVNSISKYQNISDAEIASLPESDQPLVTKFRIECRYLALVTAQTWAKLYLILAEVKAGTRPMPTGFSDIEGDLPPLVWPI